MTKNKDLMRFLAVQDPEALVYVDVGVKDDAREIDLKASLKRSKDFSIVLDASTPSWKERHP